MLLKDLLAAIAALSLTTNAAPAGDDVARREEATPEAAQIYIGSGNQAGVATVTVTQNPAKREEATEAAQIYIGSGNRAKVVNAVTEANAAKREEATPEAAQLYIGSGNQANVVTTVTVTSY